MKATRLKVSLVGIGLLLAGWVVAYCWSKEPSAPGTARKVAYYQDSMHPWVKSASPGKCTICAMDLTPVYEGEGGFATGSNVVVLGSNNVTVANVQTEAATRRPFVRTLRVAGVLEADSTRKTILAAPAPGRIDNIAVASAGVEVRHGQVLATFYSPDLTFKTRRYIFRDRVTEHANQSGQMAGMAGSSRHAANTDMAPRNQPTNSQEQVSGDPYYNDLLSTQAGTVTERNVFDGQYVAEGDRLFTIVDCSVLWFRFDAYEQQLPWLETGQKIEVTIPSIPGRVFEAVIAVIEPTLNEVTRTVKVRADVSNPLVGNPGREQRLLRLGMYADGTLQAQQSEVLTVPRSAILFPGGQAYAYVDKGGGAYEQRAVQLGRQGDGVWEILKGLNEGEQVVTAGNVLIDAQAQFVQGAPAQKPLAENPAAEPAMAGLRGTDGAGGHEEESMAQASGPSAERAVVPDSAPRHIAAPPSRTVAAPAPSPATMAVKTVAAAEPPAGARPMNQTPATAAARALPASLQLQNEARQENGDYQKMAAAILARVGAAAPGVTMTVQNAPAAEPAPRSDPAQAFGTFVTVAGEISRALAADDFEQYRKELSRLPAALTSLEEAYPAPGRAKTLLLRLATMERASPPPQNIEDARKRFVLFSANAVGLVRQLAEAGGKAPGFRVFHCPMAPPPGLWLQAEGPLANPFFGASMLTCGEEVTP